MQKLFLLPAFLSVATAWGNNDVPADSVAFGLDEAVVSARKWQQKKSEQTKRIATLTLADIAFQQPQTTADLLGRSGEVFIQKSQLGGGSPMIRGFATNRLLYAIDGIRMNTAIFRAGNIQNVISLDAFALQDAEIVFGPGSVVYGSDAIGGVMAFRTRTPQLATASKLLVGGSATARYASANNERTGHLDVSVGGRKWGFLSSVTASKFGDLRQGKHGPDDYLKPYLVAREDGKDIVLDNPDPRRQSPSAYSQLNLMQKLRFQPSEHWDMQYAFHYSATSHYARYDRHTRLRNGRPMYGQWDYGPQLWMLNQLTLTHRTDHFFYDQMAIRGGIQRFEESRIDRRLNKSLRTETQEVVDAYSLNADFTKTPCTPLTLSYGMEYVHNRVRSHGKATDIDTHTESPATARYPQARWESAAAYFQSLLRLSPRLRLEGGLRYTHYRLRADFTNHGLTLGFDPHQSNSHGALSASLGMTWQPSDQWLVAGSLSNGFRTPNVDDMGKLYDAVAGAVTVPNPTLRAEYAYNAEVGVTRRFGHVAQIQLSAYYTHLDNALVRRPFVLNGQDSILYKGERHQVLAIQNAAVAHVYGFQIGLKAQLPLGFALEAHANYQKGREELDDGQKSPLRHAAPFFGRATLSYAYNRLLLQFATEFQGRCLSKDMPNDEQSKTEIYTLDADGHPWSPAWCAFHLKAQYKATARLWLHLSFENITNRRYRPYSSGISAPGQNLSVALTYRF